MIPPLSENYIQNYIAKWVLPPPGSIFQVLGTKPIQGDSSNLKFRLCLSDGINRFSQAMLMLPDQDCQVPPDLSVIKMKDESSRPNSVFKMNNKLIWIVKDFEVIAKPDVRIGNPASFDPSNILSQSSDQAPVPTTPSPSFKAVPSNGISAPPAGPSKRPLDSPNNDYTGDRTKQARRALFTDTSSNGSDSTSKATQSISSLSPFTNKFTIKARVTKKSELRHYHNSRGSGKVFDVVLQDSTGDIKASCFNETAEKMSQIFQENKVYFVSMAFVKSSNPAFNPTKHPYELSLTTASEVVEVRDSLSGDVPEAKYDYVRIGDIESKPDNELVDVIGVCTGVDDVRDITVRSTGRQVKKRDIRLSDALSDAITVTLWSQKAEDFDKSSIGRIIRIRRAKVTDFNGKSLTLNFSSSIESDPKNCPESEELLAWWTQNKDSGAANCFSRLHKFEAYVVDIKADNVMYQACSECNKKVVDMADGSFRCEKCGVTKRDFSWRYILRAAIADMTDYQWVTLFDDSAQTLVGLAAHELRSLFDRDPDLFRRKLHDVKFSLFEFVSKTKCEKFNDENRIKMTVINAKPITQHSEGRRMERLKQEIESMRQLLTDFSRN